MDTTSNQHSACWRLFNNTYLIYIKYKYYKYINNNNQPIKHDIVVNYASGITKEEIEEMIGAKMVHTKVTAITVLELCGVGANFAFENGMDACSIYSDIIEHFNDWIKALNNPFIQRTPPPIEDFVKLDELASKIFAISKNIITNRIIDNGDQSLGVRKWLNDRTNVNDLKKHYVSLLPELYRYYDINRSKYGD